MVGGAAAPRQSALRSVEPDNSKRSEVAMSAGLSSSRWRSMATTASVALTLLLGAAAGCDSRQEPDLPSVQEKLRESHIWGQSVLRIGVADDEPLMGEV